MSGSPKPPYETSDYTTTLSGAWTTLTTVATPSHCPVQQLTISAAHHTSAPHVVSHYGLKDQWSHSIHDKSDPSTHDLHRYLKTRQSFPDIVASGLGYVPDQCKPAELSDNVGHSLTKHGNVPLMEPQQKHKGIGAHVHPSLSIKNKLPTKTGYQSTSQVFQERSSPESKPHTHPMRHAFSDRDIHVTPSFQTRTLSPPPSPGKLAMKYKEHLDNQAVPTAPLHRVKEVKKSGANSRTSTAPPSDLQERQVVSPVKATALVAPYAGDSGVNLPIQGVYKSFKSSTPLSGSISKTLSTDKPPVGAPVRSQLGSADKWKSLVETKDRILSQKNHLIERLFQSGCISVHT